MFINFKVWFLAMLKANKTFLRVVVFTLVLSMINVTPAWSRICASLFQMTVLSHIEQINLENNRFLSSDNMSLKISKLKEKNREKVDKIFDRLTKRGAVSEKDIHHSAEELVILLYGKRDVFLRYFTTTKMGRANESARYQTRRQLIEKGLKSFLENHTPTEKTTMWIKVQNNTRKLFQTQFWNWYQLPWGVPRFKDKPMTEVLMNKIIWDGITPHEKEIMAYYGTQNPREFYASMRYTYTFIALSVLAFNVSDAVISRASAYGQRYDTVTLPIELPAQNSTLSFEAKIVPVIK